MWKNRNSLFYELTFSGMISEMTKNGNVRTPQEAINITNEKATSGTHLKLLTSTCVESKYV